MQATQVEANIVVSAIVNTPAINNLQPTTSAIVEMVNKWVKDRRDSISPFHTEFRQIREAINKFKQTNSIDDLCFDALVVRTILAQYAKELRSAYAPSEEAKEIAHLLQNFLLNTRQEITEDKKIAATLSLHTKYFQVLEKIYHQQKAVEEAKQIKFNASNIHIGNFDTNQLSKLFAAIRNKFKSDVKEADRLPINDLRKLFNDSKNVKGFIKHIITTWIEKQSATPIGALKSNTGKRYVTISGGEPHGYKGSIFTNKELGLLEFSARYNHFKNGGVSFPKDAAKRIINELFNLFVHYNGNLPFDASALFTVEDEQNQDVNTQETRKSTVAFDVKQWQGLDKTGVSKYLERKGLTNLPLELTKSIRYGKGFISIPIWHIDQHTKTYSITGTQKIFDENLPNGKNKIFSSGLEKTGNCAWLGVKRDLKSGEIRIIRVVEGLATGLSILLAFPNDLVAVALDAGNLSAVGESVRRIFGTKSKCEIIFCADNDEGKANNINPATGRPIGNIGSIRANEAALRVRGKVAIANFKNFHSDRLSNPTDFNDLHQIAGLDEVRRQVNLATKPDANIAFYHSRFEDLRRSRDLFAGHKRAIFSSRYLPDMVEDPDTKEMLPIEQLVEKYGVIFIKAPIGCGKTEQVKQFTKTIFKGKSILCSTHLISLVANIAQRLGIENYADYKGKNDIELLRQLPKLAICLNSLPKLLDSNNNFRFFDVIVLDEVEQLAKRLLSQIPNKRLIMMILKTLIQKAKHVVLLDAHLGKVTKNLLERWRPNEKFLCLLNEFKVGEGREAIFYDSANDLLKTALEKLQAGEKVFLAFNSRRKAREAFKLFKKTTGKKGLYISGVNNGDKKVLAFFDNVNEESKKYDFVVVTPAVCTGISIDHDHFTFVGGSFSHRPTTPQDALQAIGRIRQAKTLHLFVSDAHNHYPTDEQTISAQWLESHKFDLELANITNEGKIEIQDEDYNQLKLDVTIEKNYSCNDFLSRFMRLLDADGYKINYQTSTPEETAEAKFIGDVAKELEEEEFKKMRLEAKRLTDEEEEKLDKKSKRTLEETAELDRKKIDDFYHIPEDASPALVKQILEDDERGKLRQKITTLELVRATDEQLLEWNEDQTLEIDFVNDRKKLFAIRELYRRVLTIAGVNIQTLQPMGVIYNSTNGALEPLQDFLLARQVALGEFINTRWITDNPVKLVGIVLNRMGIRHETINKNHKDRQYQIKSSTLDQMRNYLLMRGTLKTATPTSLNNLNSKPNFGGEDDANSTPF